MCARVHPAHLVVVELGVVGIRDVRVGQGFRGATVGVHRWLGQVFQSPIFAVLDLVESIII